MINKNVDDVNPTQERRLKSQKPFSLLRVGGAQGLIFFL
jgi:hypothetical protein